jgi:ABC-2 type transport system permease protein
MRKALHAEWTKLRTTAGPVGLLLGLVVATVGLGATVSAVAACPRAGCQLDTTRLSLAGIDLGQALVAILAVLAVSGEHSTGLIRVTLTALPRRPAVLAAKAAVLTVAVAVTGSIAVAGSLLVGRPHGPVLRPGAGSVLYLVLIAWLSLGIAAAVRDSAAAIGLVLGLLYLFPVLAAGVGDPHWQRLLQQVGPMNAGLAIQATVDLRALPISPWAGLAVLTAWAATALLLGGWAMARRDV